MTVQSRLLTGVSPVQKDHPPRFTPLNRGVFAFWVWCTFHLRPGWSGAVELDMSKIHMLAGGGRVACGVSDGVSITARDRAGFWGTGAVLRCLRCERSGGFAVVTDAVEDCFDVEAVSGDDWQDRDDAVVFAAKAVKVMS